MVTKLYTTAQMIHHDFKSPLAVALVSSICVVVQALVPERFTDTIKEQTKPDTHTEEHRKVGDIRELLWLCILVTQLFDVSTMIGYPYPDNECKHHWVAKNIKTSEVLDGSLEPSPKLSAQCWLLLDQPCKRY
jgi:hypothetical protein